MKKFINKVNSLATKACVCLTTLVASVVSMVCPAYAVTINSNPPDFDTAAGALLDNIFNIITVIGIAAIIFGIFSLAMSFMQEQPERRTQGISCIAAGALIVTTKIFLTKMGYIS